MSNSHIQPVRAPNLEVARLEKQISEYERAIDTIASRLRAISWSWVVGSAILVIIPIELWILRMPEGIHGAALIAGPGAVGLALSFIIERLYFLGREF